MGDEVKQDFKETVGAAGSVETQHIEVHQQPALKSAVVEIDLDISKYTPEELQLWIDMVLKKANTTGSGTLKLAFYEKGSIKLFLTGSEDDIAKLREAIESGSLRDFDGHQVLETRLPDEEEQQNIDRVQEIQERTANLKRAERRETQLMAELVEVQLIETQLRAQLIEAQWMKAQLIEARLIEAQLIEAQLIEAQWMKVQRRVQLMELQLTKLQQMKAELMEDLEGG